MIEVIRLKFYFVEIEMMIFLCGVLKNRVVVWFLCIMVFFSV